MMIGHYVKSGVLKTKMYNLNTLKVVMSGGAKLTKNTIEEFKNSLPHTSFVNLFGSIIC